MNEISFENKFTTINNNMTLPLPEIGDVVNDGDNRLVVCAVEQIEGKNYVLFCDEKTMKIALYEIDKTNEVFSYILIHDDTMLGKVVLNIVKKHDIEGEE